MSLFWKVLCGVWIAGVIVAAFLGVGPALGFREPEAARIIFFHVPTAWLAVLGFILAMLNGIHYLRRRELEFDRRSAVAAEMGFLFSILATVTGAVFAQAQWGAAWNWDPRQTAIVGLLLVYGAYFALRSAIEDEERRAALSASYAILAVAPMLFLVFVLPRILESVHPRSFGMSGDYRVVFFASLFGFTVLFAWIYRLRVAVETLALRRRAPG